MEHVADPDVESLRQELQDARLEEAEALRRALHLRAIGESYERMHAAMREVEKLRSKVTHLHLELRRRLH